MLRRIVRLRQRPGGDPQCPLPLLQYLQEGRQVGLVSLLLTVGLFPERLYGLDPQADHFEIVTRVRMVLVQTEAIAKIGHRRREVGQAFFAHFGRSLLRVLAEKLPRLGRCQATEVIAGADRQLKIG